MSRGYLLDTHVFLRMADPRGRRGTRTDAILADPSSKVFISVISAVEAAIKDGLGKLNLPPAIKRDLAGGFRDAAAEAGFLWLVLEPEHAALLGQLPLHHRDPFDRMLICQAMAEDLVLVSDDRAFPLYSGLALLRT